jgi:hypothetical protein
MRGVMAESSSEWTSRTNTLMLQTTSCPEHALLSVVQGCFHDTILDT